MCFAICCACFSHPLANNACDKPCTLYAAVVRLLVCVRIVCVCACVRAYVSARAFVSPRRMLEMCAMQAGNDPQCVRSHVYVGMRMHTAPPKLAYAQSYTHIYVRHTHTHAYERMGTRINAGHGFRRGCHAPRGPSSSRVSNKQRFFAPSDAGAVCSTHGVPRLGERHSVGDEQSKPLVCACLCVHLNVFGVLLMCVFVCVCIYIYIILDVIVYRCAKEINQWRMVAGASCTCLRAWTCLGPSSRAYVGSSARQDLSLLICPCVCAAKWTTYVQRYMCIRTSHFPGHYQFLY